LHSRLTRWNFELPGLNEQIDHTIVLNAMPEGVALVDGEFRITWANRRLEIWCEREDLVGKSIYEVLPNPQITGPDFCPFDSALVTASSTSTTLETQNAAYDMHVAPLAQPIDEAQMVVTLTDISEEITQRQKLKAIHQAGVELTDLKPEEIFAMDVDARIDLLKDNIRYFTQDLLNVNTLEIRLLNHSTGALVPLLSIGMDQAAADRKLQASPQHNGVTGYVAASGESYLCEDTLLDTLYLESFEGARSSLTVPLFLHDRIAGTMNVESPNPKAFTNSDMQFLEIFSRSVAQALNTFELMVFERSNAAQQSCEQIHAAVSLPIDDILLDTVHCLEEFTTDPDGCKTRLQRVLKNARNIRNTINRIEQSASTAQADESTEDLSPECRLKDKRILVVDSESQTRNAAHNLLERYGCIIETAGDGEEAVMMVRNCDSDEPYDMILSDIRLPDYSGYQLLRRLTNLMSHVPMALMTGFGYDPGHSIVKARQAGVPSAAILYKPFRTDTLMAVTTVVFDNSKEVDEGTSMATDQASIEDFESGQAEAGPADTAG
jgi:CheY-like chemotaxis protein